MFGKFRTKIQFIASFSDAKYLLPAATTIRHEKLQIGNLNMKKADSFESAFCFLLIHFEINLSQTQPHGSSHFLQTVELHRPRNLFGYGSGQCYIF